MERADFDTPARVSQCRSAARRRGAHGHPGRGFATLSLMADQRSLFHAPPARERRSISLSGVSRRRAAGLSAAQLLALGLWPGALRAADATGAGSFRFVVINDVHYRDERCGAWLEKIFRQIKSAPNPPDFCLMAGDYSENGTRAELAAARDAFKLLGVPVFGVVGNHDFAANDERGAYDEIFPRHLNYRFEQHGWQFLALDSTQGRRGSGTSIPAATLQWLDDMVPKLDARRPASCA
jgi:hypothetical protein